MFLYARRTLSTAGSYGILLGAVPGCTKRKVSSLAGRSGVGLGCRGLGFREIRA